MSKASDTFVQSIRDAENLLSHFNSLNKKPPPEENEVLKRAGLIMAMTAWETYVEDRVEEAAEARLQSVGDPDVVDLVRRKLSEELSKLHNPTAERTIQIFNDYAFVDPSKEWSWGAKSEADVRRQLNSYLKLRGDVVHRSRVRSAGRPQAHPVRKEDLERAIRFLKHLVDATERAFLKPQSNAASK